MSTAVLPLFDPPDRALPARRRPVGLLAIGAAHVAVLWLLLQSDVVTRAVQQATPLMVALLAEPARPRPPEPLPPPPRLQVPPPLAVLPPPELQVKAPDAPAAPALTSVAPPVPAPVVAAAPAPAEPLPVRVAPATPPTPPVLPASAIRYRVPPPVEVPLASRRLHESGTVLLRVLVDAQGLPRLITLHRSSGFARLDEQALAAMRQARFQTVNDNGSAIEWVVIAPLQYDVD